MVGNSQQIIQFLFQQKDLEKKFEVKEYKPKRTLNQNAYCWELIGQIADNMRLSKEAVYLNMLRDYGQSQIVSVRADIDVKGFFKYYEEAGAGTVNGTKFTHWKVYKGSSEFDTREMAIFITGIVQEAKNLGIQTLDELELKGLKEH